MRSRVTAASAGNRLSHVESVDLCVAEVLPSDPVGNNEPRRRRHKQRNEVLVVVILAEQAEAGDLVVSWIKRRMKLIPVVPMGRAWRTAREDSHYWDTGSRTRRAPPLRQRGACTPGRRRTAGLLMVLRSGSPKTAATVTALSGPCRRARVPKRKANNTAVPARRLTSLKAPRPYCDTLACEDEAGGVPRYGELRQSLNRLPGVSPLRATP